MRYIIDIPEKKELIGDVYYPDERDDPMPIEPLVQCKDCKMCVEKGWSRLYCDLNAGGFPEVEPDGFCAWGERREA